jgi:hypothetical protein
MVTKKTSRQAADESRTPGGTRVTIPPSAERHSITTSLLDPPRILGGLAGVVVTFAEVFRDLVAVVELRYRRGVLARKLHEAESRHRELERLKYSAEAERLDVDHARIEATRRAVENAIASLDALRQAKIVVSLVRYTSDLRSTPVLWAGPVRTIVEIVGSPTEAAEALGVSVAELDRYLSGTEHPSQTVQDTIVGILSAAAQLRDFFDPTGMRDWLLGTNAHLYDQRPVDVIRGGGLREALDAIKATKLGAFA